MPDNLKDLQGFTVLWEGVVGGEIYVLAKASCRETRPGWMPAGHRMWFHPASGWSVSRADHPAILFPFLPIHDQKGMTLRSPAGGAFATLEDAQLAAEAYISKEKSET